MSIDFNPRLRNGFHKELYSYLDFDKMTKDNHGLYFGVCSGFLNSSVKYGWWDYFDSTEVERIRYKILYKEGVELFKQFLNEKGITSKEILYIY